MLTTNTPLASFTSPIRAWFQETFGQPTPPQAEGWPAIQRGEHTLILAPTGSGKTLAAFLWGIDQLYRELTNPLPPVPSFPHSTTGIRLVYISPLKALNNDIHRNLRQPLAAIRHKAKELDLDFPTIELAVRSGDTPSRERQAMLRRPPHILITTPESLYLLLTSPKARDLFRTVHTIILDEIHTLAGSKRGVHLALSLERLQCLAQQPIQRIGLSATIQPLEEVARFLGGNDWIGETSQRRLVPRPVTIVNAAYEKKLDLQVVSVVDDFRQLPGDSIWPTLIPRVVSLIRQHQTTLIFANNRLGAERAADRLNVQMAAEAAGQPSGLVADGLARGLGMLAAGTGLQAGPVRVHHGSVSKETRLALERDLKEGKLPALVGTSSLELGIDIGSVDLVIQLQSPKSVAQGLQRVGRSGHLVGQTSQGRIFPTHREDVMEAAAIAGGMLRAEVEPTYTPRNCLDVLAQQIVALVSVETWDIEPLFDLVRCAYAYEDLTFNAFQSVLEMLAGRYPSQAHRELRPRLAWDRVNNKLASLPGSRLLALSNGGTIPDRGSFSAYLADGKTKLGELDEEFVYETRIGDTLMFGSQVWRVVDITDDNLKLVESPGATPRMPFWRGDYPWRPYQLGRKVGAFRRAVVERLRQLRAELDVAEFTQLRSRRQEPAVQSALDWLRRDYALNDLAAWQVLDYVAGQLDKVGAISTDRTIVVEIFDDPLGDPRMVIHSPFGGRVNGPWGLALAGALRERTGVEPELQTNDDAILLRFPDAEAEFPLDIVAKMGPAEARERILRELPNSAVFGAHFRQNAARALLLPGARGGKRTPFWLQRLRAKDLLQVVRQFADFPIIAETYRDCLEDVLDLPHLEELLAGIQAGDIQVVPVESLTPSPVAQSLLWDLISIYMYEWDAPKAERQLQTLALNRDLLQDLLKDVALDDLLRSEAVEEVRRRLQHTSPTAQARTAEELAVLLQQMGDLSSAEIAERAAVDPSGWLAQLAGQNRLVSLTIPTARGPETRWVAAELAPEYQAAFADEKPSFLEKLGFLPQAEARRRILERFLDHAGPVTTAAIQARYAFPEAWLQAELDRLVETRQVAHGRFTPRETLPPGAAPTAEFIDRRTLEQIHRRTLTILRREVQPVPFTAYADFLARWQHLYPSERLAGPAALTQLLQQLRAAPVVGRAWERDVLPLRLAHYDPAELAALCQSGELIWVGSGGVDPRRSRVAFLFRGEGHIYLEPAPADLSGLAEQTQTVYDFLKSEGAVFFADICAALELEEAIAETALIELVMAGLVTNDSLAAMRQIVQEGSAGQPRERKPFSSLEAELAERLGPRRHRLGLVSKPGRAEYEAAKRRVRERLLLQPSPTAPRWLGRWSLIHRFGVMGKALSPAEQAAYQARQLLARYGVVTRDSLANEPPGWAWELIYQELQRLEIRGEVRRGYFVRGLPGLQFALPEVVERLRAARDDSQAQATEADLVVLNACDPANLYGPTRDDAPRLATAEPLSFARLPSTWLVQQAGLPLLIAENSAAALATLEGVGENLARPALAALLAHLSHFEHRLKVETWNTQPILDSPARPLLESLGFYRDYPGMTWERR
jgi:ATP-dependent Lhr-like helicase